MVDILCLTKKTKIRIKNWTTKPHNLLTCLEYKSHSLSIVNKNVWTTLFNQNKQIDSKSVGNSDEALNFVYFRIAVTTFSRRIARDAKAIIRLSINAIWAD